RSWSAAWSGWCSTTRCTGCRCRSSRSSTWPSSGRRRVVMVGAVKYLRSLLAARPWLRVALQAAVSAAILGLLVAVVWRGNVIAGLRLLHPGALALAAGLQGAAYVLNSYRWKLLLRGQGVRERFGRLTAHYFVGLFCSLSLPGTAGG